MLWRMLGAAALAFFGACCLGWGSGSVLQPVARAQRAGQVFAGVSPEEARSLGPAIPDLVGPQELRGEDARVLASLARMDFSVAENQARLAPLLALARANEEERAPQESLLALPEGWRADEAARRRLRAQLLRAASEATAQARAFAESLIEEAAGALAVPAEQASHQSAYLSGLNARLAEMDSLYGAYLDKPGRAALGQAHRSLLAYAGRVRDLQLARLRERMGAQRESLEGKGGASREGDVVAPERTPANLAAIERAANPGREAVELYLSLNRKRHGHHPRELARLLEAFGFTQRDGRGDRHRVFIHPLHRRGVTVSHHNDISAAWVGKGLEAIRAIRAQLGLPPPGEESEESASAGTPPRPIAASELGALLK